METELFSSDSFDPVDWINGKLDCDSLTEQNKESYASSLLYRVQVMTQEVNNSLEELSRHLIKDLPRVLSQAEVLEETSNSLNESFNQLRFQVKSIVDENESASKSIERLKMVNNSRDSKFVP